MKDIIKIQNLKKTYLTGDIAYQALKGISFTVKESEMVAIMGPSGSGKSTTMHILGLLDTADSGSYQLSGLEVGKYDNDRLAEIRNKEIGFVFQSFNLLPRASVAKNVELPLIYRGIAKEERQKLVKTALKEVGLLEKAASMPNQISGGQVQRVAIARAIAGNPGLILADEPTGNLDSVTALDVMRVFQQMNKLGKTIVMITHEHDIAACCKRIIRLQDGQLVSDEINTTYNNLLA